MSAAWPRTIWPVTPVARFSPSAAIAKIQVTFRTCSQYVLMPANGGSARRYCCARAAATIGLRRATSL